MYTCYIQSFKILAASVAEQAGLNLTCSKISEDTFSRDVAQLVSCIWFELRHRKSTKDICPTKDSDKSVNSCMYCTCYFIGFVVLRLNNLRVYMCNSRGGSRNFERGVHKILGSQITVFPLWPLFESLVVASLRKSVLHSGVQPCIRLYGDTHRMKQYLLFCLKLNRL